MVHFTDSKYSFGQDVLVIRGDANHPMKTETILVVFKVVSSEYVSPLPKISTTSLIKNFSMDFNFKRTSSPKHGISFPRTLMTHHE